MRPHSAPPAAVALAASAALAAGLLLAGCASMQSRCAAAPWLLCGDRLTVHRTHVHLDDPAYLYNNRAVARGDVRGAGDVYAFRLSLFFNPHRGREVAMGAAVRPSAPPDSGAPLPPASPCRVAASPGGNEPGSLAEFESLPPVFRARATDRKERVALRFLCKDYRPRWGRQDTLELRFAAAGPGADSAGSVLDLPITTGFHGPVYSFLAGSTMLLGLTVVGELLAD